MKETNFEDWDWEPLANTFGLKRQKETPVLNEWLQSQSEFSEMEKNWLKAIQEEAQLRGNALNEDEVKFHLIAPLTRLAAFPIEPYSSFNQRYISCVIGEYRLAGKPDFMLATGINTPHEPFFFLQEYKPEQLRNKLPLGQLLAAMLTAQKLNGEEHAHPILGATVIASTWNFVVLDGDNFAVSREFTITGDDIFTVVSILRAVNGYVNQWIKK